MILKRIGPIGETNEIKEFNAKFKDKTYSIKTDGIKILEVRTEDKEILQWCKDNDF